MALKPKHQRTILWASLMIAVNSLIAQQVQAVETENTQVPTEQKQADNVVQLNTIVVKATAEEEKPIGKVTSGVNKEDIERRGTNNVADLLTQISNVSLNGLYARPDVSIAIQGIGGRGRVSQSLEGIQQSFEAFTHNFNQSGTILVNPAFLRSIDVTQGATSDANSIGNLAGSANFSYLNADDVLMSGQDIGGTIRLQSGIGEWANGQKFGGTGLFAARGDNWEFVLGGTKTENEDYHMGKNLSTSDYVKYSSFPWGGVDYGQVVPTTSNGWAGWDTIDNDYIHYNSTSSWSNTTIGKNTAQLAEALKSAAKNSVSPGTFRKTEGYFLKGKYLFDDEYNQSLELFATQTKTHYQSDVQSDLRITTLSDVSQSYFYTPYYYVDNSSDSQVYSLKWQANFSDWFNPEVKLFHQKLNRIQLWANEGFYIPVSQMAHYSSEMDTNTTGIQLANTSHFADTWLGDLQLQTALQYKHDKHTPNDFTQNEAYRVVNGTSLNNPGYLGKWNPDSKSDSVAFSFDLNNHEDDSPWKWNIGAGVQQVRMKVLDATLAFGNIKNEFSYHTYIYWMPNYSTATSAQRRAFANGTFDQSDSTLLAAYEAWQAELTAARENTYDGTTTTTGTSFINDQDVEHNFTLGAGNLSLQYTIPDTGLSFYGQASYGERAPTSSEMYMYGNYYKFHITQSRNLKSEKNLSLQLGSSYSKDGLFTDDDSFNINAHLYQNTIKDYIMMGWHQLSGSTSATSYDYAENDYGTNPYRLGYAGYINNDQDWVTRGLGIEFNYKQPEFYLRGNVTVPFKKFNKFCWDEFPDGNGYISTYDSSDYSYNITSVGTGRHVCGNAYKWAASQTIDPVQASLTAAITPFDGKLELGTTLYYRGKQRSYFYVDPGSVDTSGNSPYNYGDFATMYRFPDVFKVDIFANYKFSDQLKVGLYLANATDQLDMIPYSEYADMMPGRTLTASLEYRYGDGKNIFGANPFGLSEDYNWTGWHTGIGIQDSKFKLDTDSRSLTDNSTTAEAGLYNAKTTLYDLHLGYDWQLKDSPWVVGLEGGINTANNTGISRGDTTDYTYVPRASANTLEYPTAAVNYDFNWGANLRGRVGYAAGRALFYGIWGVNLQNIKQQRNQYRMLYASANDIYGAENLSGYESTFSESDSDTLFGWNLGLGVEYAITNNLSLRAEYNYSDLGSVTSQFDNARADANIDYETTARVQYQCGVLANGNPRYCYRYDPVTVEGGYDTVNGRQNKSDIKNHNFGLSLNWRF